jgi:CRP-like cAMP-binding protein
MLENLCKPYRNDSDNHIIKTYLKTLPMLSSFIRKDSENMDEIYSKLTRSLKYSHAYKNKVLFRYGLKAETFYISIKGNLAVLIPEEEKLELSEEEFMLYLIKLKRNDELDILTKCLELNKKAYPITEYYESWFDPKFFRSMNFKRSVVTDIQEYLNIEEMRQNQFEEDDMYETPEDYILKNMPERFEGKHERKLVTIYVYHHVHNVVTGSKFGDVAFHKPSQKRTATIIAVEDCHLGILSKKFYDDWFQKLDDNNIKMQINFLSTIKVFQRMNKAIFQRHNFYLFSRTHLVRGDKIIIEGNEPEYIYFIKEGDYELSINKSIIDMTNTIEFLSGKKTDIFEYFHLSGNYILILENPEYSKFMHTKKFNKLVIIKDKDVVGLDDCLCKGKYIYTVELISSKGEVFKIKRNVFIFNI